MKITIFINFSENILKNPIAITLDDSETLAALNKKRIEEYKTPYDRVYNSSDAMPLQYQHKGQVFTSSDLNESLHNLGLRDNDSININISNIDLNIMKDALTADLLATDVNDPDSHSTPLSLALFVQRQLSNKPWTKLDIQLLKENIDFAYTIWLPNPLAPYAYIQLASLYSALDYWGLRSFDLIQQDIKNFPLNTIRKLTEKSSLIYLVPRTLQNTIEEKNNVLLKFSHTRNDDQLLLFRNELRFLLKEKGIENSEVNIDDNIIRITNINLAKLVEIDAIPILPDVVKQALLTDLEETKPEEALSNPISSSLKLIAKRQQSENIWEKKEILTLQNHLAAISGDRPGDYPQLLPQYALLNLLRSRMLTEKIDPNIDPTRDEMLELSNALNESKVDFSKIKNILSQNTCIYFNLNNKLTNSGLIQLAKVLQNNKTITTFILLSSIFDMPAITELAKTLQCNTTLETFRLQSDGIENSYIDILVDSLKNNKTLLTLEIFSNKLSQKETEALANLLRTSTTLRSVALAFQFRSFFRSFSDNQPFTDEELLIQAAKDSTSLENFTYNGTEIFKNKQSFQLLNRRRYTNDCMLSLLDNDFKNFTDVTERSGHLDFKFAALTSVAEIIIQLQLLPNVLAKLMTEYLKENEIISLSPLPMTKEIFAKKPSLAELINDIALDITVIGAGQLHYQHVNLNLLGEIIIDLNLIPSVLVKLIKEYLMGDAHLVSFPMTNHNSIIIMITFHKNILIDRKLLFRNALMDLFIKEKMTNTIEDFNFTTEALTISNVTFEKLVELNIIPRGDIPEKSHNGHFIMPD